MEVLVKIVWNDKITEEQKEVLNKFNVLIDGINVYVLQIEKPEEIFRLAEQLDCELIVSKENMKLEIYDQLMDR